jgi:hypothetical protein
MTMFLCAAAGSPYNVMQNGIDPGRRAKAGAILPLSLT